MTIDSMASDAASRPSTLKLLTTGGTIATRYDPDSGRTHPALGSAEIAALVPSLDRAEVIEVGRTPSWAMTLADMAVVARAARDAVQADDVCGVVVTVGTSALEYVAYLTDLYVDSPVPVVFTGAMRKADEPDPDGPNNLADAVRVASSPQARDRGVLVAFAGDVLSARGCWKMTRSTNRAFIDVDGPVGAVDGRGISFLRRPPRTPTVFARPDESVEMLKVYPGADAKLLDAVRRRQPRGVVIEGMPGAGGIPPGMHDALADLAATDTIVVISSKAPSGVVPDPPTGGTGSPIAELPLLSAGPLTTEKAWVLLSVALGASDSVVEARTRFASVARGQSA